VLAQSVIYLCVAAKTDASYKALGSVQADVEKTVAEAISIAHNVEGAVPGMECLPEFAGRQYYFPTDRAVEKRIAERLEELRGLKEEKSDELEP
jgi:replication-associated recombination protein RarA